MTDTEKLAIAIQALETIRNGSRVSGRWIEQFGTYSAIDGYDSPDEVPDGYYDERNPPAEDGPENWPDETVDPAPDVDELVTPISVEGRWLLPAVWEGYTGEEQDEWLASVTDIAVVALVRLA